MSAASPASASGSSPLPAPPPVRRVPAWARTLAMTLYYLGIIAALIVLYGRGDFSTPKFIYQGF